MRLGIPLAAATVSLIAFYAMDFTYIHHDEEPGQANGSGRSLDFPFFILVVATILMLPPICLSPYKFQMIQTWGTFTQLVSFAIVLTGLNGHSQQYYVDWINIQLQPCVIHADLKLSRIF